MKSAESHDEINKNSKTTESSMAGGDGTSSYYKNSNYQRIAANIVKAKIDEEIFKNLDVKSLSSVSNTIRLADLGCSTGPNTFIAVQSIIDAIKLKQKSQLPVSEAPEFQVFFCDRTSNDFNTLFSSIPQADTYREYFPVGVPGSFHARLFPESSLHFAYTSHALHWLSKTPEAMLAESCPGWNKGRVHYLNAPREVYNAYASQFSKDVEAFLDARAKEIVGGGMMVIIMGGVSDEVDPISVGSLFSLTFDFVGSILVEMAKEGLLGEALLDSFNILFFPATLGKMVSLLDKNGSFSIERIEFVKQVWQAINADVSFQLKQIRAVLGAMLSKHFGSEIIDEMFVRFGKKFIELQESISSVGNEDGQLFIVLKRK